MRTFVTCALLAATVAMFGTASAQAYDGYRYYYHRRPFGVIVAPPVVLAPAPLVVAPPVIVAQPPVFLAPAPVVVGPVIRPGISLRVGIGR